MALARASIANKAEAAFAAEIDRAGKTWIHQPRLFRLPPPHGSYLPDFYVVEDSCFYEVCGTRQAYSYRRAQIEAFRIAYPKLTLKVANSGAWAKGPLAPRIAIVKKRQNIVQSRQLLTKTAANIIGEKLVGAARIAGFRDIGEVAIRAGLVPSRAFYAVYHHRCSVLRLCHSHIHATLDALAAVLSVATHA